MKRMTLAVVIGAVLLAGPASAQTPPPAQQVPPKPQTLTPPPLLPPKPAPAPVPFPAEAKVAFVSMQTVVAESQLGKAGQKTMQALTDKKTAEVNAKQKAVQTLQSEIQQQQAVLSAAALQSKKVELDRLTREAEFAQQDMQAEVTNLNQQLLDNFKEKVVPIIDQMRTEKGLWAVWSIEDSGVAVWMPGLDLSMEVVKRLDASAIKK
jgi:Skp family chaperone for outer membrane proteins